MTAFWNDCLLLTNGTGFHLFKSKGIERETETSKGISTGQTYQIKRVHISKTTFDSISLYQALWFHAKVLNFFFEQFYDSIIIRANVSKQHLYIYYCIKRSNINSLTIASHLTHWHRLRLRVRCIRKKTNKINLDRCEVVTLFKTIFEIDSIVN